MIDVKTIKNVFKQCKDALSVPYKVDLITDYRKLEGTGADIQKDFGACRQTEVHGFYEVFINPIAHDSIEELKNTCIHELLHTYFMPSHVQAIIGLGKEKGEMYCNIHEKDISTMATYLCRTIQVKEELDDDLPIEFIQEEVVKKPEVKQKSKS